MQAIIYARKEPGKSPELQAAMKIWPHNPADYPDVVLYWDADATQPAGRIPWHYKQPDRRNRWKTLNCYRYRLQWLPDALQPVTQ